MESPSALAARWHEACRIPSVAHALNSLHSDVRAALDEREPACWASGRCCHFEKAGHRLYVTGLEAADTLRRVAFGSGFALAPHGCTSSPNSAPCANPTSGSRVVTLHQVQESRSAGVCPFLRDNACSIHEHRPIACRIYFCDRSAQDWQRELYEMMQNRIRDLHNACAIPYVYAEWRELLATLTDGSDRDCLSPSSLSPEPGTS
jgi:Fe-S-cluster containining protein